jgi:integrase
VPVGVLSRAAAVAVGAEAVSRTGIWERLAAVPDPRSAHGRVYPLPVLAAVWLCTVTAAGHDRIVAVTEWLAATTWAERVRLRLPWDPWNGHRLPDETTIRRFLNTVDDQALAAALLGSPLADVPADLADVEAGRGGLSGAEGAAVPVGAVGVRAYAVDGKTSRGAKRADGTWVHLLGVASHGPGRLVGQREIDAESNETAEFRALLAPLDLAGAFVSFDALSRRRYNASYGDIPDRTTWTGRRDHALLTLAIHTGLRVSELTALTPADLHLQRAAHVRCLGKGRKQRITPLAPTVVATLRTWLAERAALPGDALFPTRRGTPLSSDAIERRLARHAATATLACPALTQKKITPHVLRHTTAMRLLHAGVDTTVIALWLGHENVATTQIYIHADLALKEKALARTAPTGTTPGRYQPPDPIISFLENL